MSTVEQSVSQQQSKSQKEGVRLQWQYVDAWEPLRVVIYVRERMKMRAKSIFEL